MHLTEMTFFSFQVLCENISRGIVNQEFLLLLQPREPFQAMPIFLFLNPVRDEQCLQIFPLSQFFNTNQWFDLHNLRSTLNENLEWTLLENFEGHARYPQKHNKMSIVDSSFPLKRIPCAS